MVFRAYHAGLCFIGWAKWSFTYIDVGWCVDRGDFGIEHKTQFFHDCSSLVCVRVLKVQATKRLCLEQEIESVHVHSAPTDITSSRC